MSSAPGPLPSATVDPALFRQACGQFATGITVITTVDAEGRPLGFTANSFTSVSLEPPLVLFCIDRRAQGHATFLQAPYFAINILAADQQHLSRHFAQRQADRFADVEWSAGKKNLPLLTGVLAQFECRTTQTLEAGDHSICIGEVIGLTVEAGDPLLYFGSRYRLLT